MSESLTFLGTNCLTGWAMKTSAPFMKLQRYCDRQRPNVVRLISTRVTGHGTSIHLQIDNMVTYVPHLGMHAASCLRIVDECSIDLDVRSIKDLGIRSSLPNNRDQSCKLWILQSQSSSR